jgi:hypothetical protein
LSDLEWLTFKQSNMEPSVGTAVCVQHPNDGSWYRGVVDDVRQVFLRPMMRHFSLTFNCISHFGLATMQLWMRRDRDRGPPLTPRVNLGGVAVSAAPSVRLSPAPMCLYCPSVWNSLPADTTRIDSLPVFRRHLKSRLFRQLYPDLIAQVIFPLSCGLATFSYRFKPR